MLSRLQQKVQIDSIFQNTVTQLCTDHNNIQKKLDARWMLIMSFIQLDSSFESMLLSLIYVSPDTHSYTQLYHLTYSLEI